jgi:TonB-linked SusC/RagA family outer membrane protein
MKKKNFYDFPDRRIFKILLFMKMTIILILVFTLDVSAVGFGQISINSEGKSVKEILNVIEQETNYRFFYNDALKSIDNVVDMDIKDQPIDQVLDNLFASTEFGYKIMDNNLIVIMLKSEEQQQTLTGTVTDASTGEGLAGVSIVVKGTTVGVISDANGNYSINLPDRNSTLVFSSVGYLSQEIAVGNQTKIDVKLSVDVTALEEVIVVGYGTQKKSDITGTVTSLPKERLQLSPNLNVTQAIQGSVPGVMIETNNAGANPDQSIMIRGRGSITADNEPLIIVDGIAYGGSMSDINPKDIESVEILKDASAAAIYGSRGANGVILITTKQGTAGKTVFSYDGKFGFSQVINTYRLLTGPEFYDFKSIRNPAQFWPTEIQNYNDGVSTNWVDLGIRTGQTLEQNLSVSGGINDTKFYLGGGLTNIKGVALGDNFKRVTTRINVETKLLKWITVGTRTQLNFDDASGDDVDWYACLIADPLGKPYDENGNYLIYPTRSLRITIWRSMCRLSRGLHTG